MNARYLSMNSGYSLTTGSVMKENRFFSGLDSCRFISSGLSGERYPGCSGRSDGAIILFKKYL